MQLDIERYRVYIDHFDMSEERKVELIHIVCGMMQSFVDRAFGESSEQILLGIDWNNATTRWDDALDSDHTITPDFNDAANEGAARKRRS
jgi:hypothetical protein